MKKKLHISLNISKLKVNTYKITNILRMRNFIVNFIRILGSCKEFAGNRVNELGNIPRCGVVPKFTDLEVMVLRNWNLYQICNFFIVYKSG